MEARRPRRKAAAEALRQLNLLEDEEIDLSVLPDGDLNDGPSIHGDSGVGQSTHVGLDQDDDYLIELPEESLIPLDTDDSDDSDSENSTPENLISPSGRHWNVIPSNIQHHGRAPSGTFFAHDRV